MTSSKAQSLSKFVFRPILKSDLEDIFQLALQAGSGFTSLQPDREYLLSTIVQSEASFKAPDAQSSQRFMIGIEDISLGRIIGCAALKTRIGGKAQFVNFELVDEDGNIAPTIESTTHLRMSEAFNGATEIGTLFLAPEYRKEGLGRYLANVRYLLAGIDPGFFSHTLVAELRGVNDDDGVSAFYECVYRQRLNMTFEQADAKYATGSSEHVRSAVPKDPIALSALPKEVLDVIGRPHPTGVGAYKLLLNEGFVFAKTIDLFDAGPIVCANITALKTVQNFKEAQPHFTDSASDGELALVGVKDVSRFRAVISPAKFNGDRIELPNTARESLRLNADENICASIAKA